MPRPKKRWMPVFHIGSISDCTPSTDPRPKGAPSDRAATKEAVDADFSHRLNERLHSVNRTAPVGSAFRQCRDLPPSVQIPGCQTHSRRTSIRYPCRSSLSPVFASGRGFTCPRSLFRPCEARARQHGPTATSPSNSCGIAGKRSGPPLPGRPRPPCGPSCVRTLTGLQCGGCLSGATKLLWFTGHRTGSKFRPGRKRIGEFSRRGGRRG